MSRSVPFLFWLLAVGAAAEPSAEAPVWPVPDWTAAEPASVGLDAVPLKRLAEDARAGRFRDLHSLVVARNGRIVLEEYLPGGHRDQLHTVQSVSKSVTSALVGIAVQQGLLDTQAPLLSFFPGTAAVVITTSFSATTRVIISRCFW